MLTSDQIRLRIRRAREHARGVHDDTLDAGLAMAVNQILDLLDDVLPEIVAELQSPSEHAWHHPSMPVKDCPDCTPDQPCKRARALVGEST